MRELIRNGALGQKAGRGIYRRAGDAIEVYDHGSGEYVRGGAQPADEIETILRIHYMQQWFGLSDPAMEEAPHDVPLYLEFAGLGSGASRIPDETTILRFRHLVEKHDLAVDMLRVVNDLLQRKGLLLKTGTAVAMTGN